MKAFPLIVCLVLLSCGGTVVAKSKMPEAEKAKVWPEQLRGVTTHLGMQEKDIEDLSTWKVNLVRLMLGYGKIVNRNPPYDFNEESFKKIDLFLDWCEKRDIRVLIDVHEIPGKRDVCEPKDKDMRIWQDLAFHDLLVKTWEKIASRYASRGSVIAGYDILNEPNPTEDELTGPAGDWQGLAKRVTKAIRVFDKQRPIIIESLGWASPTEFNRLKPTGDPFTIYSFHFYRPQAFTTQGVTIYGAAPSDVTYPTQFEGELWDGARLEREMQDVIKFQKKYKAEILVGEFSALRYNPDGSTYRYLKDCVDIFEKYGWSWTYHGFREFTGWSLELSTDAASVQPQPDNDRLNLMKGYFGRNLTPGHPLVTTP